MSAFSKRRKATVREGAAWFVSAALLGMNLVLAGCAGLVGANNGNPNPTAPAIIQVSTANITKNSAQIDWTTNVAATSQVQYGTSTSYGTTTPLDSTMVTMHSVSLGALTTNQTYHFRVVSTADGQLVNGSDQSFTTATNAAAITGISPNSGSTAGGTQVTISGSNFVSGAAVQFGATAGTAVTVVSATQVKATTPAHAAGAVTVVVTNPSSSASTPFSSFTYTTTSSPPAVSTTALSGGTVGAAYSATLQAIGGRTPYTWTLASGTLPAGLTLSSAGAISGTPTTAATSSFTVQVKDSNNLTATKALSITVGTVAGTPLAISTTSLGNGVVSQTFNTTIKVTGGKASYTFSLSTGSLPAGLTLAASTGVVSGTPATAGSSTFTVKVTDSSSPVQTASKSYTLTISAGGGAMDQYLGLMSAPCTNNNTSFIITKVVNNMVFCSPAGHAMFARGFYVFDDNSSKTDESGGSPASYATAKYGNTTSNWAAPQLTRIKNWGFNAVGPFSNAYARPVWSGQTVKVPFILFENSSSYSLTNNQGWGKGPVKDFLHMATATWQGYRPGCGIADYRDPNWAAYVAGTMINDYVTVQTASASAADKGYLLGVSFDDSDCLHGFGAGPDFATQPAGNNDFRLGYVTMFIPPTAYANSAEKQIYTDGTVYMRKRLHDMLKTAHGTISSLNSTWGSAYTSFDSTGTCVGSQPITCASSVAANAVGSGNGSTMSFSTTLSHTTVSAYSVAIHVGGTLVGGDTGAGKIYGPSLSGTVNYSTGALSLTFSGTAPPASAAITASYIANGWGIGTGFLDEDCRSAHASYCGSGKQTVTMSDVPAAVQADLNALTKDIAAYYSSTLNSTIQSWASAHGFVGHVPHLGPSTLGTWTTPPDRYVLQGFAGNVDAWQYGGAGTFTQAELDFIHTNMGDVGLIEGEYRTANADSPYAFPNSAAVHSGSSVTVTIVTPSQFINTSTLVDVTCSAADFNAIQVRPTAVTASTVTYNVSGTPAEASTRCNIRVSDKNVGGFPTQAARGQDFFTKVSALPTRAFTANGTRPYVGYLWWQYQDNQSELLNWGVITLRDNAYDGTEDVNPAVSCVTIITSATCGKELRGPYGSVIPYLSQTNAAIDAVLAGL